jgi:hypothetical protein
MNENNLPGDKHERTVALVGAKAGLMELIGDITDEKLTTVSEISGAVWNMIEKIDSLLEG